MGKNEKKENVSETILRFFETPYCKITVSFISGKRIYRYRIHYKDINCSVSGFGTRLDTAFIRLMCEVLEVLPRRYLDHLKDHLQSGKDRELLRNLKGDDQSIIQ